MAFIDPAVNLYGFLITPNSFGHYKYSQYVLLGKVIKVADTEVSWQQWKHSLAMAIDLGKGLGLSDDRIARIAQRLGDFLAKYVDPRNREQRVLRELWDVASEEERLVLARLMTKLLDDNRVTH
ncbi:MAG: hypothetical protein PWP65_1574 [Clostridia bacterium]|nr:hypothetical protein [Clostridia bacterium]